jgi:hypothetical protein
MVLIIIRVKNSCGHRIGLTSMYHKCTCRVFLSCGSIYANIFQSIIEEGLSVSLANNMLSRSVCRVIQQYLWSPLSRL